MIAELMLHVCASLSSSLHRCSLISSTDQIEQPRISTSLLSPELSSSPKRNERQTHQTLIQTEGFVCSWHEKQMHTHFCLTILKCLHQSIRISQSSKVDKSLRHPVVRKHSEPIHVGNVAFSSGLHDAPEISHQDLSSLVE